MLARRLRATLGLVVGVLVLAAPATAVAQTPAPPGEAYPPAAIVNLLDPFGCAPSTATGSIGAVLPGSTVNLELVLLSSPTPPLSTATATAGADGHAVYSIPVPPDRFGAAEVRATGTNTLNQPFAISSPGTLVPCPAGTPAAGGTLPTTGSSGTGIWLRLGAAVVLAGALFVVIARRRWGHSVSRTV